MLVVFFPKMDVPEIIAFFKKQSLGVMSKDNGKENYFSLFSKTKHSVRTSTEISV